MARKNKKSLQATPINITKTLEVKSGTLKYNYVLSSNVRINNICCIAWATSDSRSTSIQAIIKFNNQILEKGEIETTSDGTAYSSCIYDKEDLCSGTLTFEGAGSNFKKGLKITMSGYQYE